MGGGPVPGQAGNGNATPPPGAAAPLTPGVGGTNPPLGPHLAIALLAGVTLTALVLLIFFTAIADRVSTMPQQVFAVVAVIVALVPAILLFAILNSRAESTSIPGVTLGGPAAVFVLVLGVLLKNGGGDPMQSLLIQAHEAHGGDPIVGDGRATVMIGRGYQQTFQFDASGMVRVQGLSAAFASETLTVTVQIGGYRPASISGRLKDREQVVDIALARSAAGVELRGAVVPEPGTPAVAYSVFVDGRGGLAPDPYGHFTFSISADSGSSVRLEIYRQQQLIKDTTISVPPPRYVKLILAAGSGAPLPVGAPVAAAGATVMPPTALPSPAAAISSINAMKALSKQHVNARRPSSVVEVPTVTSNGAVDTGKDTVSAIAARPDSTGRLIQHVRSDTYTQESVETTTVCTPPLPEGWTIVPSTVRSQIEWMSGPAALRQVEVSPSRVCFVALTPRLSIFASRTSMRWHYEYDTEHAKARVAP